MSTEISFSKKISQPFSGNVTPIIEKIFYQISDPTQNVPEGDDSWIDQLKQENIMCDCGNIIKHTAIDIFLNEKIKKVLLQLPTQEVHSLECYIKILFHYWAFKILRMYIL